jgi:hypothetical protein
MANIIYPKYKQACFDGTSPDLTTVDVKAVLVDLADYTYDAAHDFLDDIIGAGRVSTSPNLTTKTIVDGVFDCDTISFTAVSGDEFEAIVFYHDTAVEATSRLIAILDTGQTGLPFTPSGGDVDFIPNASGVFAL